MPYCPTHGFQQGKFCSECSAPLSETPPATGDSVDVKRFSPESHAHATVILPGSHVEARPASVKCPRCGHRKAETETFDCTGDCGRQNLCLRHFDEDYEVCADCARVLRGEAKAEAERQAKLHADLAAWRKRAEQAETQVSELTQQGQQAQQALERLCIDLEGEQEHVHTLERQLGAARDHLQQAEAQVTKLTQDGQQMQQALERARADLRQAQERVRGLEQELAAQRDRAEQAEASVAALTKRSEQAESSLAQRTTALSQAQERVLALEKDLANWRGRAEKAEGELAIIEHARQEAEAKKRREIVGMKPGISILDKYHIIRLIGEGGMARVWLAEDQTSVVSRQVAIKESKAGVQDSDTADPRRRFEREATVAAALVEAGVPNIVPVWQVEPLGSGHVLVMSYMPGGDLADLIGQHPAGLPLERAVAIALDVLAALAGMHKGDARVWYIHGDVKPSNILFDMEGRAHLTDFGLARVSFRRDVTQQIHDSIQGFGTPLYMAPECESPTIDIPFAFFSHRADLYSLGCVFWEMLTGKPYKHSKPGTPPSQLRAGLPAKVEQVVMKALAGDYWSRWHSAEDMAEALQAGLLKSRSRRR